MKKRIAAILMATVMVLALSVTAFAADGITDEEQAVLDHFAAGRQIGENLVTPFPKYITVATNSLIERAYTAEELARVTQCIDECYDILEAEEVTCFEDMKHSQRLQEVVDKVTALANSLGYKLTFDYNNGDVFIVLNQTGGFPVTATIIIGSVLVAAIVAAVIIISRKNLLAKAN